MTIFFVTENLGAGGAERQLTGLAAMLRRGGAECVVVTWVDRGFYELFLRENDVEHVLLRPRGKVDRVVKLAALFRERKADAVISFLPMANETALLASLLCPVRVIVSERSFTVDWGWRRRLTNMLYRRAFRIVANSNNEARNLREHLPALANRIVAIPNYVDMEAFSPRTSFRPNSITRFVGVGRVIPGKNILRLLDALALLGSRGVRVRVEWYGSMYDKECVATIENRVAELGLDDSFKLMGECKDIARAYAAADFFVMPSLLEGYPNVLVEAMACGLPVVVSAVCEHPFIVEHGVNGFLFNPENTEEIVDAMGALIDLTVSQREKMSAANRKKIEENNSPESFKEQYLALIKDVKL